MSPTLNPRHHKPALTKILATLGPASDDEAVLTRMVEAGASLFRLNFSHGSFEDHKKRLELVRRVSYRLNIPLTVLGDLPGPKLRVGTVPDGGIMLEQGQQVIIRAGIEDSIPGEVPVLSSGYEKIAEEVEEGHRVLINDGAIRMLAVEANKDGLHCRVTTGGLVTTRKGINLPDSDLSVPAVTERDWEIVEWAVENHLDFLALSFVRKADEVLMLKRGLASRCTDESCGTGMSASLSDPAIPVIAKIETPQAVDRMEAIIEAADGIMVARGDLGVEMDVAEVPIVQKRLVAACHKVGKPCIVATQMLESMITAPVPTRAEVSDVAQAIYEGADAVMLSAESAAGDYPVEAVTTMNDIAIEIEQDKHYRQIIEASRTQAGNGISDAITVAAREVAETIDVQAICTFTQSGTTAMLAARERPRVPIIALTPITDTARRLMLVWGLHCVVIPSVDRFKFAVVSAARAAKAEGFATDEDRIIVTAGVPFNQPGSTNILRVAPCREKDIFEGERA